MSQPIQRIAITVGEPAGIGPDLIVELCRQQHTAELVVIGDPDMLAARANQLGVALQVREYRPDEEPRPSSAGEALVAAIPLAAPCIAGQLNPANGAAVLATLERAGRGCLTREFAAVVTAPVQKSTITESGTPFSGHTEFFAELCAAPLPVMLLCAESLRVALVTTHLALADVPAAITEQRVHDVASILNRDLQRLFGITQPRIAVLGLNPHAGESGQLGREEIEAIEPALRRLRDAGVDAAGPLPADTAFNKKVLDGFDAVLAMYHDQGLPVLKHAGFGKAVNVTLGLPIVRTSVDHGTALDLAGSGQADGGSLRMALQLAQEFAARNAV